MLELNSNSEIDMRSYMDDLEYLGYIYVDRQQLLDDIPLLELHILSMRYLCSQIMSTKSGYFFCEFNKKNIINFLQDYENCPPSFFINRKSESGNESLNSQKTLIPLLERGYAQEFIETYMKLTSIVSIKGLLAGLSNRAFETNKKTSDGLPLHKLGFEINEADNMRVYYKKENIQSIPRGYTSCIKAPKGYVLVSGDFKQADLRIAYSMMLMSEDNVEIIKKYPDMYEAFARIYLGDEFDLEDYKENRDSIYKPNTLAPIYGATSSNTSKGSIYVKKANEYLKTCENYQEFKSRIQLRINKNLPINLVSYFGNEIVVDQTNYSGYAAQQMDKALNAPIQQGTSEIVIATERSIMDEFAKVGVTKENGGIYAYLNKHDELVFMLKEEYLCYSHIFQDHETIKVKGWVPLQLDFSFSNDYGIEDEELDLKARSFYKPNVNKTFDFTYEKDNNYIPINDILEITVAVEPIPSSSGCVISYYDFARQRCSFEILHVYNNDEVYNSVISFISKNREYIKSNGFEFACVNTLLVPNEVSVFQGILIRLTNSYSSLLNQQASLLAKFAVYKQMKEINPDLEVPKLLIDNKKFLDNLVGNEIFGKEV